MSAKLLLFMHIYKIIMIFRSVYAYISNLLLTFATNEI